MLAHIHRARIEIEEMKHSRSGVRIGVRVRVGVRVGIRGRTKS